MTDIDPVRTFTTALPYRIRREFSPDYRARAALHTCAERGDDITALAAQLTHGLYNRTRSDIGKLLRFRLLRAAGLLDEDTDQATAGTTPRHTTPEAD